MVDGGWGMEDGGWKMEDGGWGLGPVFGDHSVTVTVIRN